MATVVPPTEQLVTEILVRDIRRSTEFYRRLGFELLRDGGHFVELTWEEHRLFLAERSAFPDASRIATAPPPEFPLANVRVMVADVDAHWTRANAVGARVVTPIADRYYGLRDFTVADPDGIGNPVRELARGLTPLRARRLPARSRAGRDPHRLAGREPGDGAVRGQAQRPARHPRPGIPVHLRKLAGRADRQREVQVSGGAARGPCRRADR